MTLYVGFVVLLVKPTSEMEMKRIAVAERRSVLVCLFLIIMVSSEIRTEHLELHF